MRLGRSVSRLPGQQEAEHSMVMCWCHQPCDESQHWMQGAPAISTMELAGPEWEGMKYLQTLHQTNTEHDLSMLAEPGLLDEHDHGEAEQTPAQQGESTGRLEANPEEPSDMGSDISIMLALLQDDLQELEEMQIVERKEIIGNDLPVGVPHKPTDAHIYVVSDHTPEEGDIRDVDEDGQPYVELLFPGDTANMLVVGPPPTRTHSSALGV